MSRPRHAEKEVIVVKIKVWQAIFIGLVIAIEIGIGVGWVLHAAGVPGAGG